MKWSQERKNVEKEINRAEWRLNVGWDIRLLEETTKWSVVLLWAMEGSISMLFIKVGKE